MATGLVVADGMLPLALPVVVLPGAGPPWLAAVLFAANAVLMTMLSARSCAG